MTGQPYNPSGPPPPPGTTVVVGAPLVTVVGGLREGPVNVTCQQCRQAVVTRVSYETGTLTWLICGAIALFGFVLKSTWFSFHSCLRVKTISVVDGDCLDSFPVDQLPFESNN